MTDRIGCKCNVISSIEAKKLWRIKGRIIFVYIIMEISFFKLTWVIRGTKKNGNGKFSTN